MINHLKLTPKYEDDLKYSSIKLTN